VTRVMLTIGHLERGGAELRLLHVLRAVRNLPSPPRIWIYVVSGKRGGLDKEFEAAGAAILRGRPGIGGLVDLWRALRRLKIGVLHANASLAGGLYCFAGWLAGVPVRISHIRTTGYDEKGLVRRVKNAVYYLFLNRASTRVIGVAASCQAFARTPDSRWATVYNGIISPPALVDQRPNPAETLAILVLGRVSAPKNPLRVVAIVAALRALHPHLTLRVDFVGRLEEPLASAVKAEVAARGLGNVIRFNGEADDPYAWLQKASVLLLPSLREGLPGVVLESLAAGTPVVAADLPGVAEVAQHTFGITTLDLGRPDEEWACALVASARTADPAALAAAFKASPFQFERHCAQIVHQWSHAPGQNTHE
jgi:glycosyltransferase involved in cell wall biosynthesis